MSCCLAKTAYIGKSPKKDAAIGQESQKRPFFSPEICPWPPPAGGNKMCSISVMKKQNLVQRKKKEKKKKGGAASFCTEDRKSPALAVGTRLKPARDGRWVASAVLLCFQLPTGGREACNSHGESASRFRNVGLKGSKMTHEPSRASASIKCSCQRILLGEGLIPRRPLRPGRAPP